MEFDSVDMYGYIHTHLAVCSFPGVKYAKYSLETAVKHTRMKIVLGKLGADTFMYFNLAERFPCRFASP